MCTGMPVSRLNLSSKSRNSAPPPAKTIPRSITSEPSSGGVRSKVSRTAVMMASTGTPVHVADDPLMCVAIGSGRCLEEIEYYRSALSSSS